MYDYDLSGYDATLEHGLHAVEAELGAMEHGILYGPPSDYGDLTDLGEFAGAGGAAAGAAAGTAAVATGKTVAYVGGAKAFAAGAGAVGAKGMAAALAAACTTNPAGWIVCGTGAIVGGTAGALASWRASVKNVARLKAKIKKLRETMKVRVSAARTEGKKRRLKRRYDRRIRRAQKRLDRIERVMKRRIERRLSKQKGLTARQRRLAKALGLRVGGGKPAPGQDKLAALARQERSKRRRGRPGTARSRMMRRKMMGQESSIPGISQMPPDALPAADELPESSFDTGMDLPVEQPIYKQPWFVGMVGIAVIGGILYTTRKDAA